MEEVDKIIIHSLKDIGCVINEEVKTLGQFSTDLIVEAAVRCLEIIKPGLGIPMQLPQNMAGRFHLGAALASACKELGYNGEVGYQTFLYSNVTEVRRVFMFLIEKLPKDTEKTVIEPDDPLTKLQHDIGKAIKEQLSNRMKPSDKNNTLFISMPLETGIVLPGQKMNRTPQEWRDYCTNQLPFLTDQVAYKYIFPSIITLNSIGVIEKPGIKSRDVTPNEVPLSKSSSFNQKLIVNNVPDSQNTWLAVRENIFGTEPERRLEAPDKSEAKQEVDKENGGNEDVENVEVLRNRLGELHSSIKAIAAKIINTEEIKKQEECIIREKSKDAEVRRKALELYSESHDNLRKLEEMVETATQRLLALATQWEKHRKPLVDKYREARKSVTKKANENEKQMETVRELRDKLEVLNKQITVKQTTKIKLEEEYEKLPKDINRSAYTRRIMEIIGNIKKQREEIDKVLKDTRELQKDINSVSGRLDRAFTVTDEVIFRNAKRDEASRRAYKLLITLHTDCSDIVKMVQETGSIIREIRDLEEQIDVESSKNIGANLERITADLQQMKTENSTLSVQLKHLQGT